MAKSFASRPGTPPLPRPERRDAVLLIARAVDWAETSGLCESARVILADAETDLIACDVSELVAPDMRTVDALARLTLVSRHLGGQVLLLDAAPELRELLGLAGLGDVIPCAERSALEARR